jgi:hypothetical protein
MTTMKATKKSHMVFIATICILSLVALSISADAADRLRVKSNSGVVQFVVTDTGLTGIGTGTPSSLLTLEKSGTNPHLVVYRTDDGAKIDFAASLTAGYIGTGTNHPVRIWVNSATKMTVNADNSITTASGASLTTGGAWTDASSRDYKENIRELRASDANEALNGLTPVVYNYKTAKSEKHVGFIAEDVPDLVATQDRKSLSPMDIVAVLTKVVKEQKLALEEKSQIVEKQQKTLAELTSAMARIEEKLKRLESKDLSLR